MPVLAFITLLVMVPWLAKSLQEISENLGFCKKKKKFPKISVFVRRRRSRSLHSANDVDLYTVQTTSVHHHHLQTTLIFTSFTTGKEVDLYLYLVANDFDLSKSVCTSSSSANDIDLYREEEEEVQTTPQEGKHRSPKEGKLTFEKYTTVHLHHRKGSSYCHSSSSTTTTQPSQLLEVWQSQLLEVWPSQLLDVYSCSATSPLLWLPSSWQLMHI